MYRLRFVMLLSILFLLSLLSVSSSAAQDDTDVDLTRNPRELAQRFLGFDAEYALPLPTPVYAVGDMTEFWVTKQDADQPVQIMAELAAAAPNTYLWVEEGLEFEADAMQGLADLAEQMQMFYRFSSPFGEFPYGVTPLPERNESQRLSLSNVDNDPHLFILYAHELNTTRSTIINPAHRLPEEFAPGGISNQHEMIVFNTDNFPGVPLHDDAYAPIISSAIFDIIAIDASPQMDLWLRDTLNLLSFLVANGQGLSEQEVAAFLSNPQVPPNLQPTGTAGAALSTVRILFANYLIQRFTFPVVTELYTTSGDGMAALDAVLADNNFIDPVTNTPVTVRDVFADFVMANAINAFVGDGRYLHRFGIMATGSFVVPGQQFVDQFNLNQPNLTVNQYGSIYLRMRTTTPRSFALGFNGLDQTPRLPLPASIDPQNQFYWTGRNLDRDHTLTRAIDLTEVDQATLQFDTWYNLSENWNYAYVTVSADEGQTWDILSSPLTTDSNPNSLSYGPGFTGLSTTSPDQEAPFLGISLNASETVNGVTIIDIVAGEAVSRTEILIGDVIVGYNGQAWPNDPDVFGMLSQYRPGDTVDLLIQRGNERLAVPVTLGTRTIPPLPEWMAQEIDLSDYAGQEILLRFEYISLPNQIDDGIVIDNIRIPEIDFEDDAESDDNDWTVRGWQRIDNLVSQNFLVQAATVNVDTPGEGRVRQLIGSQDDAVRGEWLFALQPNEEFILSISGLSEETTLPALFNLLMVDNTTAQT